MKKVLLASTALMFSAGFAAADMSLGGSANMGVKYNESAADEVSVWYEVDFDVKGSGETDGGLTFGASIDLDVNGGAAGGYDGEVFVSGAFGTVTVGAVDPATDPMGIADPGFDGIGVDDDADSLRTALTTADILYQYKMGAFGVDVSLDSVDEDFAVMATYNAGSFDVALGYAEDNATGWGTISLGGGATFGDIGVGFIVSDWDGGVTSYGVDATYKMGATTITAAFGDTDAAGDDADFGIGAAYDLGGGASLAGAVGQVDGSTVADFGITMKF